MINSMQAAIIEKDFKSIIVNKNLLSGLIIVPLMFTVFLPVLFMVILYFAPDQMSDFEQVIALLPDNVKTDDMTRTVLIYLFNYVLPMFFLMIPVMASTIMAASSFVGEKEKRTLETLLYCPLSLTQIYQAKVWASFFFSMLISFSSFIVMFIVMETGSFLITGSMILPGLSWLFTMLIVSPAVSLLAITFIVMISAKAKSMEEAQQRSVFLIIPVLFLIVGQFTGVMLISSWYLLIAGIVFGTLSYILMKRSMRNVTYEKLLM